MMKNSFFLKKLNLTFIIILIFLSGLSAASKNEANWVLAAEKFTLVQNKTDSVSDSIASLFPSRILDYAGTSLYRTVFFNEQYERESISLKTQINSLFLQLSAEIKKRDTLVVGNYSQKELKNKLKSADEKVQEIKNQIDENLQKQKELNQKLQDFQKGETAKVEEKGHPKSEKDKYIDFVKNIIYEDKTELINEKITFYKGNTSSLYVRKDLGESFTSSVTDKEMQDNKINGFITGTINSYGEYFFVSVSLYIYPGAKYVTTVSEVGTLDELDLLSESIARQLLPSLTNALPITIKLAVYPEEVQNLEVYLDDNLLTNIDNIISLDSGVHFLQFAAKNYKPAATTYFFEGNKNYLIEVTLESAVQGTMYIEKNSEIQKENILEKIDNFLIHNQEEAITGVAGNFYINGQEASKAGEKSKITINGSTVLGEFIGENGEGAFFYIPKNQLNDGALLNVAANTFNRDDYIEKHRRRMYNAYSGLTISLMPMFIAKGLSKNYQGKSGYGAWQTVNVATTAVAAGCGLWFIYELVQYFIAADSVIPEKATIVDYNYTVTETEENTEAKKEE